MNNGASVPVTPLGVSGSEMGAEVRRDLRNITIEGALANVFVCLTGGAFLTGMAIFLGANDFELGLLAAIPFLAQSSQLVSPLLSHRFRSRKMIAWVGSLISRQLWWLLIPVFLTLGAWRLEVLLAVVVVSNAANMMITPAWLSWTADIVPGRIRGRYFATRNTAIAVTTLLATIPGSLLLDWFRSGNMEGHGFASLVCLACLGGVLALYTQGKLSDTPSSETARQFSWRQYLRPLADAGFRNLVTVFFVWNFAIGISAAFFAPHMLLNLNMSFFQVGLYSGGASLVAIALNRPWGALIDRFGSKAVLTFCAVGIGLTPLVWLAPRPGLVWILIPEVIYSGALWTGFNLAAFTIPLDRSPRAERTPYLAVFAVVTGLAFFIASVLGGAMANAFRDLSYSVGGQTIVNYHVLFVLSAVLRLSTVGLLMSLREPTESRLPAMVQLMGSAVLKQLLAGRQFLPFAAESVPEEPDNDTVKRKSKEI
jgi:MFS family permease